MEQMTTGTVLENERKDGRGIPYRVGNRNTRRSLGKRTGKKHPQLHATSEMVAGKLFAKK